MRHRRPQSIPARMKGCQQGRGAAPHPPPPCPSFLPVVKRASNTVASAPPCRENIADEQDRCRITGRQRGSRPPPRPLHERGIVQRPAPRRTAGRNGTRRAGEPLSGPAGRRRPPRHAARCPRTTSGSGPRDNPGAPVGTPSRHTFAAAGILAGWPRSGPSARDAIPRATAAIPSDTVDSGRTAAHSRRGRNTAGRRRRRCHIGPGNTRPGRRGSRTTRQ